MIIATAILSSIDYGDNDKIIIVDGSEEKENSSGVIAQYNSNLAQSIFMAVANKYNHFECNGVSYKITEYHCNKKTERKYNLFRKTERIVNTIKNKKIIIFVTYGTISCQRKNHKIQDAQAIVKSIGENKPVTINIEHCATCDKYFISYTSLQQYQKKYHVLLFNMEILPEHKVRFDSEWGREAHELKLLGYSASNSSGLSTEERRQILKHAIDYEILGLNKSKIKSHLELLIRRGENIPRWADCVYIWESDLRFVLNYHKNGTALYTNGKLYRK